MPAPDAPGPGPLALVGGRVVDPATGFDEVADVVVEGGRITAIGTAQPGVGEVVDVAGKVVTPGLIDGHAHVYGGIGPFHPDAIGVLGGLTAVVDAASAGPATIADAFAAVDGSLTDVFHILFVHPQGIGSPLTNREVTSTAGGRSLERVGDVPVGAIVRAARAERHRIRALKSSAFPDRGPEWVRFVCQVARWAELPAYFHLGNFGHDARRVPVGEQFRQLDPGDIVTHVYTDANGGILVDLGGT